MKLQLTIVLIIDQKVEVRASGSGSASDPDGVISQPQWWRKRSTKPSCWTVLSFSSMTLFFYQSRRVFTVFQSLTCLKSDEALKISELQRKKKDSSSSIFKNDHISEHDEENKPSTSLTSSFSHQQNMKNVFISIRHRVAFWVKRPVTHFLTRRCVCLEHAVKNDVPDC